MGISKVSLLLIVAFIISCTVSMKDIEKNRNAGNFISVNVEQNLDEFYESLTWVIRNSPNRKIRSIYSQHVDFIKVEKKIVSSMGNNVLEVIQLIPIGKAKTEVQYINASSGFLGPFIMKHGGFSALIEETIYYTEKGEQEYKKKYWE
jgi:hypothetical protein